MMFLYLFDSHGVILHGYFFLWKNVRKKLVYVEKTTYICVNKKTNEI